MATEVKRRRGTTAEHSTFTGALGEVTVDTTKDTLVVHDNSQVGGFPLLREDFSNVPQLITFYEANIETLNFDTAYSDTGNEPQGGLYWNVDEKTLSLVTNGSTLEVGHKTEVNVINNDPLQETISKGSVVSAYGSPGASGKISVKLFEAGTDDTKTILGILDEDIDYGFEGKAIVFGKIRKIDTDTPNWSAGDVLYASSTAGELTNTQPTAGNVELPIAYVVTVHPNVGEIFVRITPIDENAYQAYDADLSAIAGLAKADGNFIVGNGSAWVAESGATARTSLGLGNVEDTALSTYTGQGGALDNQYITNNAGYITQTNGDDRYLQLIGGTLTGNLVIFKDKPHIELKDNATNDPVSGTIDFLENANSWGTTGSYGMRIQYDGDANQFEISGLSNGTEYHHTTISRDAGNYVTSGTMTAASFTKASNSGGFLKADGTEDTSTYLTSYTETDTLSDVTGRGASTTDTITLDKSGASTGYALVVSGSAQESIRFLHTGLTIESTGTFNIDAGASDDQDLNLNAGHIYLNNNTDVDGNLGVTGDVTGSNLSISNWNTAYGWGDHSTVGYLTSLPAHNHNNLYYTELEINEFLDGTNSISGYNKSNWDTAFGWGNHASTGYLTSYTETDPVFTASAASGINSGDIADWDSSYQNSLTGASFDTSTGIVTVSAVGGAYNTVSLDGRYYTETESDGRYLRSNASDTTTGNITISKDNPTLTLVETNTATGSYPRINFDTGNNQGVSLYHNEFDGELPADGYGLVLDASASNAQFPSTGTLSFSVLGEMYTGGTTLASLNRVFHDGYHPNADELTTSRTISLSNNASGSVSFNGSSDVSISTSLVPITIDSNDNANSLSDGIYGFTNDAPSNVPDDYGMLFQFTENQSQQLLQTYRGSANQVSLYGRRKTGGTWDTSWTQYFSNHYHPNADKLTTAREITLGGDLTGSAFFDGSADITISAQVSNNSHTHDDRYLQLSGGGLTGDLDMNDNTITEVESIILANKEGELFDTTSGRLMFDENFYSDTEYGVSTVWTTNGGGLVIRNEDGWGRILSDKNMEYLNASFASVSSSGAVTGSNLNVSNWDTAFGWGNHASAGYLTSFTETDPTVPSHVKSISTGDIADWNASYQNSLSGASFDTTTGIVTVSAIGGSYNTVSLDGRYYTETEIGNFFGGTTAITGYNKTNWDSAYNNTVASASFNSTNGVLTLTQVDGGFVTVDLDGRYLTAETGDISEVIAGTGLSGGGSSGSVTLALDFSELSSNPPVTIDTTDQLIWYETGSGTENRTNINSFPLSKFNNDSGFTSNIGDITGVTAGTGLSGGGTSGSVTLNHATTSTLEGSYGSTADGTKVDSITVDAFGHVTAITTGATGDITGVTAGTGLSGGGTSGTVTLNVSGLSVSEFAAASIQTGAETFVDSDTVLMTAAAVQDKIESYGYSTTAGDITGVTAGSGISGGGTSGTVTISHEDTSSQGSVNNSGGTVIQDVTLDTYGHVTGLVSYNLDGRYYTESEADGRFVNVTGDSMSGNLTISGTLSATVKSFNIEHPTQKGKRLVYGVLEGNEHAVFVRGRSQSKVIELPEEWSGLIDPESITVQLTSIGNSKTYHYKEYKNNKIYIGSSGLNWKYDYFYIVHATRIDVEPLEVVQDAN